MFLYKVRCARCGKETGAISCVKGEECFCTDECKYLAWQHKIHQNILISLTKIWADRGQIEESDFVEATFDKIADMDEETVADSLCYLYNKYERWDD